MTSSTSNSEAMQAPLPDRKTQLRHLGKLLLRILLPLLALGVLFCIGLDWLVRQQLIGQTSTHGANKLTRIQALHPNEIPIFGSSRALCSYIPDSLGADYYNYGINGIGYAVMDIFLQQELAHREKKTPIVLNFDYLMFGYQMGDLNTYLPHSEIPEVKVLLKRNGLYGNYMRIPGIRYYGSMDAFTKDRLNEKLQLTKAITRGAAIEKAVTTPEQMARLVQLRKDSVEHFKPAPELVDTLVARISQHPDRQFYVVVAPYHQAYYGAIPTMELAHAREVLALIDALPNARVIDFDTRDWPDTYFFNTTHVSMLGAQAMSKMLRDTLALSEKLKVNN